MVKLTRVLKPLRISADPRPQRALRPHWASVRATTLHAALDEGRVLYDHTTAAAADRNFTTAEQ